MDWRNRIGLYGCYFCGMAGIGFIRPFLPKYLKEGGLSNQAISVVWTLAALSSLAQFPIGLLSDRLGRRKPFLVVALAVLTVVTILLWQAQGVFWLGLLAVLFAENGVCRATVESLAGAEATGLAAPGEVGKALSALRFWRPLGIVTVALAGGILAEHFGIGALLLPLAVIQGLAVVFALLIHEQGASDGANSAQAPATNGQAESAPAKSLADALLWVFVAAMVLFHVANSPPGAYLGVFMAEDLDAPDRFLSYSFVVSMVTWTLAITLVGRLADRIGRRPLLILGWTVMTLRLVLLSAADSAWEVLGIQILDGLAQALFAILPAAWVTDRLADHRRGGEAQVLVGSALVLGSALGPALAGLVVGPLGYRGLFALLAGVGMAATALVVALVPETLPSAPAGSGARSDGLLPEAALPGREEGSLTAFSRKG